MFVTIELPDDQVAALSALAKAKGLSLEDMLRQMAAQRTSASTSNSSKSAYGILSQYGSAPSPEEIAETRREMFQAFGESF